ncbi:MAG: TonB-dependent receptor [Oceanobacter sp.]
MKQQFFPPLLLALSFSALSFSALADDAITETSTSEPEIHPARDQLKHEHGSASDESNVEEVVVTGHQPSPSSASSPLLSEEELQGNRGGTLGELMESIPGVSNASFGQGVARPVVRGMSGNRVQILSNGSDTADLSAMSSDHAPMADLAAASSVQLMRGPSALRFGNSVLGGVVNVESGRIHEFAHEGLSGSVTAGLTSNNQQTTLIGTLDAGDGSNTLHLDGFTRHAENYSAGQGSGSQRSGEILNSDTSSFGAGIAYSRQFDELDGYLGLSISQLGSDYAVPNEDNEDARVKPLQTRYDLKGAFYQDIGPVYRWQIQAAHSDYEHDETLGAVVVGLFDQTYDELQTEFTYELESGWHGHFGFGYSQRDLALCHDHSGCPEIPDRSISSWDGTQGADFLSYQGYEFAHDTPMPLTTTKDTSLFITGSQLMDVFELPAELELGLRYQPRTISANPDSIRTNYRRAASYYEDKTYHPLTASASLELEVSAESHVLITLSRQQRAPVADELYWNGDHHATFSFQLDNADLDMETAHAIDLSWEGSNDSNDWQVSTYFYDYSGYIYNELKDFSDPYHSNNVYRHEQADAQMTGLELSWNHALTERWNWLSKAASNRGWLKDSGDDLPRMPADNLSQQIKYLTNTGIVQAELQLFATQNRTGSGETATDGYYLLNLAWSTEQALAGIDYQLNLKANNLTDQFGQQHVSWLKDYAPVMGRNLMLEVNVAL